MAEEIAKSKEDVEERFELKAGEIECGCREVTVAMQTLEAIQTLLKNDLKGRVEVVAWIELKEWRKTCHGHVRAIMSYWELQATQRK